MKWGVIKARLKKWFYAVMEPIAESLGLWFTVFAIVISCILAGIWIYIIYVDKVTLSRR